VQTPDRQGSRLPRHRCRWRAARRRSSTNTSPRCRRAWCTGRRIPGCVSERGLDILSFLLVAATVLTVTVLAAYIPAHHASCINPIEALRDE